MSLTGISERLVAISPTALLAQADTGAKPPVSAARQPAWLISDRAFKVTSWLAAGLVKDI
jgi:hypothetical protein